MGRVAPLVGSRRSFLTKNVYAEPQFTVADLVAVVGKLTLNVTAIEAYSVYSLRF